MSAFHTVSTVSVRGGLRARPAVLPDANQVLMSFLYTVSTLGCVVGCGFLRYILCTSPNL